MMTRTLNSGIWNGELWLKPVAMNGYMKLLTHNGMVGPQKTQSHLIYGRKRTLTPSGKVV